MTFAARAQVVVADKDKFKKRPEWAAQGAKLSTREGSKVRAANDYDDANKAQARLQSALEVLASKVCFDSYHVLEEESILCRSFMTAPPRRSCGRRLTGQADLR